MDFAIARLIEKISGERLSKTARCWEGFEPVPGKKAYSEDSCRPKTQTTRRGNYRQEKQSEALPLDELLQSLAKLKTASLSFKPTPEAEASLAAALAYNKHIDDHGDIESPERDAILEKYIDAHSAHQQHGIDSSLHLPFGLGAKAKRWKQYNQDMDWINDALAKQGAASTTIYFASPNRQLVTIPKDSQVSTSADLAYQMGRFHTDSKETWSAADISGSWTGGSGQPTFKPGKIPAGKPTVYSAQVSEADLAQAPGMAKSIKKLRRSVTAQQTKQHDEKEKD